MTDKRQKLINEIVDEMDRFSSRVPSDALLLNAFAEFYQLRPHNSQFDPNKFDELAEKAKTSKEHDLCLRKICSEWQFFDQMIPQQIREKTLSFLNTSTKSPKGKRTENLKRKTALALFAKYIIENDFHAGKNDSNFNENNSFSMVVEASKKSNNENFRNLSYNAVRDAYYEFLERVENISK